MFNGKSFNEKFLVTRKYDFARAINCTRKLTCVCACACDRTRLREQDENTKFIFPKLDSKYRNIATLKVI